MSDSICGTAVPSGHWESVFQQKIAAFESDLRGRSLSPANTYVIPVIFHVIHGGEVVGTSPNVDPFQIQSQIQVLNADFSGNGLNASGYPANAFVNWALAQSLPSSSLDSSGRVRIADMQISFCLAEKDTLGNLLPEPGIDRINYQAKGWTNPASFTTVNSLKAYLDGTIKPQSIWNVTRYLNIWISDRNPAIMYTGVATMPPWSGLPGIQAGGEGTDSTDGIWCYAKVVGSYTEYPQGDYASPGVAGRTITHEAGHYLGLRHIWGDGACATDYCDDTPPAAAQNVGIPAYPLNAGSCSTPSNSPDGEMFMNFMDYPTDLSKYMFTPDQVIRAQTAMLNSPYRNQLGTHGLCSASSVQDISGTVAVRVSPNPAAGLLQAEIAGQQVEELKLFGMTGNFLSAVAGKTISLRELPPGLYILYIVTDKQVFIRKIIHTEL